MTKTRCLAAVLWLLAGLVSASVAAATRHYSVVLAGTVERVAASSVDVVPPSENMVTIHVLRVLMPAWQTVIAPKDVVTVDIQGKAVIQPGDAVLVFGDGWVYSNNVALRGIVRPATQAALDATLAEIDKADEPQFEDAPALVKVADSPGGSFSGGGWRLSSPAAEGNVLEDPKPSLEEKRNRAANDEPGRPATITTADLDAIQQALERADLRKRVLEADMIIEGDITKIAPLTEEHRRLLRTRLPNGDEPISEHEAKWDQAEIKVKSILKGSLVQKIVILFPRKSDIKWADGPGYQLRQTGVFFLHEQQILEVESTDGVMQMGSTQQPAMSLNRRDYLAPGYADRIREIVAEPKQ